MAESNYSAISKNHLLRFKVSCFDVGDFQWEKGSLQLMVIRGSFQYEYHTLLKRKTPFWSKKGCAAYGETELEIDFLHSK